MNSLLNLKTIKELDGGQHGEVFLKQDQYDGKIYVVKQIKRDGDEEEEKKIEREIIIMKDLVKDNHPNIVKLIKHKKDKDFHYLYLEYISGKNLEKFVEPRVSSKQYIEQNLIIIIFRGILNGLIYLNQKNIMHRDISLDNIMITEDNEIKIIDFGISKYYIKDIINSIVGKKMFVNPEIYKGEENNENEEVYKSKADIFSFGVTMFYLMSFDYPFSINDNHKYTRNDNYIDPEKYNERLIDIIMSMLELDPNKRSSCQDVYQQMENLIGRYYMNINYKININDIILQNHYMAKKTAFFSIILSFYNIEELKKYFELDKIKKTIKKAKSNKKDSIVVIDNFVEILSDFQKTENRFNCIKKFISKISEKIFVFKDYKKKYNT